MLEPFKYFQSKMCFPPYTYKKIRHNKSLTLLTDAKLVNFFNNTTLCIDKFYFIPSYYVKILRALSHSHEFSHSYFNNIREIYQKLPPQGQPYKVKQVIIAY